MLLTGRKFTASEALKMGFVSEVLWPEQQRMTEHITRKLTRMTQASAKVSTALHCALIATSNTRKHLLNNSIYDTLLVCRKKSKIELLYARSI